MQVWTLAHGGARHRVEADGSSMHRVEWFVDDELRGTAKTLEDKVTVKPTADGAKGRLVVRFSALGKPQRATYYGPDEELGELTGAGGIDLVPEDGSPAAAYEQRVLDHPQRYAAIATLGGVAKVVVPILLGLVAVRVAVHIPWPDLPSVPFPDLPDLPSIPWPDLPSIPWPDLPSVSVPGWVTWLLDKVKYVWPVVLAYVLARGEVKRRRREAQRRRAAGTDAPTQDDPDSGTN